MNPISPNEPCSTWSEAISAYLDGELTPLEEQQVHAHLRHCPACSEALVDLVPVVQALRAAPQAEPMRDLWPRISAELRHDPIFVTRRLRPHLPRQVGWAAAALLVLVGGGVAYFGHPAAQTGRVADVDMYWHEHAVYSQDQGVPGLYAPALHAVQSSYDLDP